MDIKTTLPISEARKKIFEIAEEVQRPGKQYTLTEKGKPKAVVMSAEEFESWQETLEVMREVPNLDREIKEFRKDLAAGAYRKYSTLEDILSKEGYVKAGQSNRKDEISNKVQAKRGKRVRKASF